MVEMTLSRKIVLAGKAVVGSPQTATITTLPPATRFVLQSGFGESGKFGIVAGFDLGGQISSVRSTGEQLAARLGPDEWLLIAPECAGETLLAAVDETLSGSFYSLVEVSHRNAAIALSGAAVAEVLNAGCPLDLSDASFPAGSATRTLLGKAEIVLMRPAANTWRVECWRSFAPYVHAFLTEAAR